MKKEVIIISGMTVAIMILLVNSSSYADGPVGPVSVGIGITGDTIGVGVSTPQFIVNRTKLEEGIVDNIANRIRVAGNGNYSADEVGFTATNGGKIDQATFEAVLKLNVGLQSVDGVLGTKVDWGLKNGNEANIIGEIVDNNGEVTKGEFNAKITGNASPKEDSPAESRIDSVRIEENVIQEAMDKRVEINPSKDAQYLSEEFDGNVPVLNFSEGNNIEEALGINESEFKELAYELSKAKAAGRGEVIEVYYNGSNNNTAVAEKIEKIVALSSFENNSNDDSSDTKSNLVENVKGILANAGDIGIALVINTASNTNVAAVLSFTGGAASFIGFIQGPDFNLADLLKMVTKSIADAQPPLKKDRKDLPSPMAGFMHYMQYIIVAAVFVALKKKAQKVDLDLIYAATVANVNKEKDALKLFINVRMPRKSSRLTAHGSRSVKAAHTGAHKQKLSLHSKELAELDMDIDKRLKQMKYWANYLSTMKKHK